MRRPQLSDVTDRLPDAISSRLPGNRPTRRVTGKRVLIGGGALTLLALLGTAARKRYITGTAEVNDTTSLSDGRLVVSLVDGTVLVVGANAAQQAKAFATTGTSVDYRVSRTTIGGIPAGTVSRPTTGIDD